MSHAETSRPACEPRQFAARVLSVRRLCEAHFRVVLCCEDASGFRPGRFVQITGEPEQLSSPRLQSHDWQEGSWPTLQAPDLRAHRPLLRRPYSPEDVWREADGSWRIALIVRVVGPGTAALAARNVGDSLDLIGPIGNGFQIPKDCTTLLLLAGGTGVAPLIYLARQLQRDRGEGRPEMMAFFGAATRDAVCVHAAPSAGRIEEFGRVPARISTDDGSVGFHGQVTALLERTLAAEPPAGPAVLLCAVGPEPMMAAATQLAAKWGLAIQVSLERKMGCGLGTCQSCVVPVRVGAAEDWAYKLTCRDGPVFDGHEILWAAHEPQRPD
jgi:dihydroorotate dehydrogenase electron transfer subunit